MALTCIIQNNALIVEGIKSLLAAERYEIGPVYSCAGFMERSDENNTDIEMVIAGIESWDSSAADLIKCINTRFSKAKIVCLASEFAPDLIRLCLTQNVYGLLARDISALSLLRSLEIVKSGEKVYTASILDLISVSESQKDISQDGKVLSQRELCVLQKIAEGKTNKQIALGESITEATVKIHVKAILRKKNLSNRTQAAIWAIKNGADCRASGLESVKAVHENRP